MLHFLGSELDLAVDTILVRQDQPVLFTAIDFQGQRWLVIQAGTKGSQQSWLCAPVTDRQIECVVSGSAAPRDVFRHTATGTAILVSPADGPSLSDHMMLCPDIPDRYLPAGDWFFQPHPETKDG